MAVSAKMDTEEEEEPKAVRMGVHTGFDGYQIRAAVDALRKVSDSLHLAGEKPVASKIDKACAFMEMNDGTAARSSLDEAIALCPMNSPSPDFFEAWTAVRDVRARLPDTETVNPEITANLVKKEDGLEFEQIPGNQEAFVHIDLPMSTQKDDVDVAFKSDSLKVSVKGHEKQPIIDNKLLHPINPSESAWYLETIEKDQKKVLTLHIEKLCAEAPWPSLFVLDAMR